jgi:putative ABC transport system substrate-binding protein
VRRRQFIALLGGVAAWPLAARSQQPAVPVIGFLRSTSLDAAGHLITAFRQGLRETGFVEGQNVAIEFRSAEGRVDRLPALAAALISIKVAMIVGNGESVLAAKAATTVVPLIFVTGVDPVSEGLVDAINRPERNVTGATFLAGTIGAKQLGLLHDVVPRAAVIAVLIDPNHMGEETTLKDVEAAVRAAGLKLVVGQASSEREIDAAFISFAQEKADALFASGGPFLTNQRQRIVSLALRHALPGIYSVREYVELGGLMSYGPSQTDSYRQAGIYAGRILNGSKPADLPVMQPTKFELIINLKAAKALGLTVPPNLLFTADEVIE